MGVISCSKRKIRDNTEFSANEKFLLNGFFEFGSSIWSSGFFPPDLFANAWALASASATKFLLAADGGGAKLLLHTCRKFENGLMFDQN